MSETSPTIKHIAFIPDGNRRWAKGRNLQVLQGHKAGLDVIESSYDWLMSRRIKYATFFVFSEQNWSRASTEVTYLFNLFLDALEKSIEPFNQKGIRFRCIGDTQKLPEKLRNCLEKLIKATENNDTMHLTVAMGYSGRGEIVRATKKIAKNIKNGDMSVDDVTEDLFSSYLDTKGMPDPDIIVRTSERRFSNFMLWQMSYSEFFFVDKYWPDFNEHDLDSIIADFSNRERRYGK